MPLDPEAQRLLDTLARIGLPPIEQLTLQQAREQHDISTVVPALPKALELITDGTLPGPNKEIPIRKYIATEKEKIAPICVYFHGGGWVLGNIDTHDALCRRLAEEINGIVVSVDYRLAPEHPYPAAADDADAALQGVALRASEWGGDAGSIFVAGDSAGGNLAAVSTLMARDRGGVLPVGQVLAYPITDCNFDTPSYLQCAQGYMLTRKAMRWFWTQYAPEQDRAKEPYASPLRASTHEGLPPTLIQTAEYDPLRHDGENYAQALADDGVDVQLTHYQGMLHGFLRRTAQFHQAETAMQEIRTFVKRICG